MVARALTRARLRWPLRRRRTAGSDLTVAELRKIDWELRELSLARAYFQDALYRERLEEALAFRLDCLEVSEEEFPIAYRELVAAGVKAKTWRDPETEDAVVYVLADLEPQERRAALLRELAGRIAPGYPVPRSRLFGPNDDSADRAYNVLDDGRLWREERASEASLWFPKGRLHACGNPPRTLEECEPLADRRATLTMIAANYGPRIRLDSADRRFLGLI